MATSRPAAPQRIDANNNTRTTEMSPLPLAPLARDRDRRHTPIRGSQQGGPH